MNLKDRVSQLEIEVEQLKELLSISGEKSKDTQLTQSQLKRQIHYNPMTGIFTRRKNNKEYSIVKNSPQRIYLNKREYTGAQLAVLYMTGKFPVRVMHKNKKIHDDRYINLSPYFVKPRRKRFRKRDINLYKVRYLPHRERYIVFRIVDSNMDLLSKHDDKDSALSAALIKNYELYDATTQPEVF